MKKHLLSVCIAALALAACSDNDKEYYLKNIPEAEEKLKECNAEVQQARQSKDKEKLEKLKADLECQSAAQAIKENRIAEAKRKREEEEEKRRIAVEEAKKQVDAEFAGLDWRAFTDKFLKHQCTINISNTGRTPECTALYALQKQKSEEGQAELMKMSLDDLILKQREECREVHLTRSFSVCEITARALAKKADEEIGKMSLQELDIARHEYEPLEHIRHLFDYKVKERYKQLSDEMVQNLLKDYEAIKKSFNECVDLYQAIPQNDSQAHRKFADTYPCKQIREAAARALKMYSFDQKIN